MSAVMYLWLLALASSGRRYASSNCPEFGDQLNGGTSWIDWEDHLKGRPVELGTNWMWHCYCIRGLLLNGVIYCMGGPVVIPFVNCSQIGTQFDWSTNQLVPQFRKIWRSLPGPMDAIFVAQGVSEFIRHSVGDFCSSTRLKFWEDCIALM